MDKVKKRKGKRVNIASDCCENVIKNIQNVSQRGTNSEELSSKINKAVDSELDDVPISDEHKKENEVFCMFILYLLIFIHIKIFLCILCENCKRGRWGGQRGFFSG